MKTNYESKRIVSCCVIVQNKTLCKIMLCYNLLQFIILEDPAFLQKHEGTK